MQKLPKYHIFVDVTIYPLIDCELCYHCFTLQCECAQMDMMMKTEKGKLNHKKYLMTGYHICIIKYVSKI